MSTERTESTPQASPSSPPPPSTPASSGNEASNLLASLGVGKEAEMEGPFIVRTLAEIGPNLPVGFLNGDAPRVRAFRMRPFRLKEERELADLRAKAKGGIALGSFVAQVMTKMVQVIGPHSFDAMKEHERRVHISQLTMADVFYLYVWLRYEALGAETPVGMTLTCPRCNAEFPWEAELGSLRIRIVPDATKNLRRKIELRDGIPIQGEVRRTFYLEPLKWGQFEHPNFNVHNRAERELAVIRYSIVAADGVKMEPIVIHDRDMDEMTKFDMTMMTQDIEENTPGPQFVLDVDCPTCRVSFHPALDWTSFDSFFSRSSPRRTSKPST